MCAIVDNNVANQHFGKQGGEVAAAEYFFDRVDKGVIQLVVGGELRRELSRHTNFGAWFQQALLSGHARTEPDEKVDAETASLKSQKVCKSDDAHVLALARVSKARLLFTNDLALRDDFKNRKIIDGVRGRIYSTRKTDLVDDTQVRETHRRLLSSRSKLCNR